MRIPNGDDSFFMVEVVVAKASVWLLGIGVGFRDTSVKGIIAVVPLC